jgi:cell division transport system permease protein
MQKLSYVTRDTILNIRRNPLLSIATILSVVVSCFLAFVTLAGKAVVEENTSRWQNGVHVVIFLDDRVTTTAHKQLQDSIQSYEEVRDVQYFSKEAEFRFLFQDQTDLIKEVDFSILPASLRVNLLNPSNYQLIIDRLQGNPAVREVRASGEAIQRLLDMTSTLILGVTSFASIVAFAAFILIGNTIHLTSFAKREEIEIMKIVGASSLYIRLPFVLEALLESLIGSIIAVGLGVGLINYISKPSFSESIFTIQISDGYLLELTLIIFLASLLFGLIASYLGTRKLINV